MASVNAIIHIDYGLQVITLSLYHLNHRGRLGMHE